MAVYRNLQEQVFENTKDIEELQQNTNNLELDIVDEQNKTQHITANSNTMYFNIYDGQGNNNQIKMSINLWQNWIKNGSKTSDMKLEPDNLTYYYQDSATDTNLIWDVQDQMLQNSVFSGYATKLSGKYIIDNYTIDENTQTINLTLTQL